MPTETLADLLAGAILAALAVYAVTGGADFGGGVWDLLARGPRAARQRALVAHAIGPIWEANHVWLILAVVLLFSCFPAAFGAIGTLLHVPLSLLLVGIVLRGSAFAFRAYGDLGGAGQRRWGRVFAIASLVSPLFLGVTLGAVARGRLPAGVTANGFVADFVAPWLAPFPLALGGFALALFSFLAAVYLAVEAGDEPLARDFRRRGLAAGGLALALGTILRFVVIPLDAPILARALAPTDALFAGAGLALAGALAALARGHARTARGLAALAVFGIVADWGWAQYPWLIVPTLTVHGAAAPRRVLELVLLALLGGSLLLLPALAWLFHVFKGGARRAFDAPAGDDPPATADRS